jgi:nuclear GTP-binding protein
MLTSDLVPRETLESWVEQLPLPTILYSASSAPAPAAPSAPTMKGKTAASTPTVIGRPQLLSYLATLSVEKAKSPSSSESPVELSVALMGLPNVGKTSIVNSLLAASSKKYETAPTVPTIAGSKHPEPTTKRPTEVRIEVQGSGVRIIDTPGWDYADDEEEDDEEEDDSHIDVAAEEADEGQEMDEEKMKKLDEMEAKYSGDLLRRNMGRVDRVKNPVPLGKSIYVLYIPTTQLTCSRLHHLEIQFPRSHASVQCPVFQRRRYHHLPHRCCTFIRANPQGQ